MTSKPTVSGPDAKRVRSMFDEISPAYDRANNVLSMGIHHLWRKRLVALSGARAGQGVLDCATGTGDLAIEFKRVVGVAGSVIGTDFSPGMLNRAPLKARAKSLDIDFRLADVTDLDFPDAHFDISSIAFGIRNVQDPLKGLDELARVVKSGGRVMVLEFGQPQAPGFGSLFKFYSKHVLPRVGGWISGKSGAYRYLEESSAHFPCGKNFADLMKETGRFSRVDFKPLSLGIAYAYVGHVT